MPYPPTLRSRDIGVWRVVFLFCLPSLPFPGLLPSLFFPSCLPLLPVPVLFPPCCHGMGAGGGWDPRNTLVWPPSPPPGGGLALERWAANGLPHCGQDECTPTEGPSAPKVTRWPTFGAIFNFKMTTKIEPNIDTIAVSMKMQFYQPPFHTEAWF